MWLWRLTRSSWWVNKLETYGLMCSSSLSLKAWEPGELMSWFQSEGLLAQDPGRAYVSVQKQAGEILLFSRGLASLSCWDHQLIRWYPPTLGRTICFTQSTYLKLHLSLKYRHPNTQKNIWPSIWALCGPVKLTHKITHLIKEWECVCTSVYI